MDKIELPLLKGKDKEKCIPLTITVGLIILVVILSVTFLSLTIKRDYKMHYSETSNLDYKVYLKKNSFYTEQYLGKDQMYIASLIDYINTDFDYTFTSDENIGLEYNYYIEDAVQVNDVNGTKIFEKKENILNNKRFKSVNNNTFKVDENIKINYTKYNNIAKDFINEYGITADSKLVVSLYVNLQGEHAEFDEKINNNAVMKLEVPLTNKMVKVGMDYDLSNSADAVLQYRSTVINNPVIFNITIVLAVLDILAIVVIVLILIKQRDPSVKYDKRLKYLIREYREYLTETAITERAEDLMQTRSLRIEMVKTFEGLITIANRNNKEILFHEERPGEEAIFYILTDRTGYIYILRAIDMK